MKSNIEFADTTAFTAFLMCVAFQCLGKRTRFRMVGACIDITERTKAEAEREIMIQFLRIANGTTGHSGACESRCRFLPETVWLRSGWY